MRDAEDPHLVELQIIRLRRALLRCAARIDRVDRLLAYRARRRVVALERHVRDIVEVRRCQSAVWQRARSLERDESLEKIQMAAFLENPRHVMSHDARLRMRDDDGTAQLLDQRSEI